jgi:hypothetical protein
MPRRATVNIEPEKKPKTPSLVEIGSQNILPWGWYQTEEAFDYSKVSLDMLDNMLDMDGQAQSVYRLLTIPLRAGVLSVKPVKGGKAEADFIRTALLSPPAKGGIQTPWSKVITQIGRALLTGCEVFEKVYEKRRGFYALDKIAIRPRKTLIYLQDDKGEFNGVRQFLPGGAKDIPKSMCFRYLVGGEFNPMYGRSMFLPAYYHYEKKHKLYYTGHIAFAINATGIRIGGVPQDVTENERRIFQRQLEQVGFNSTIIKPEGYSVDVKSPGSLADAMPYIDHHDNMMAKAVLGQIIDIGTSANPGSFSLSESHMGLLFLAIEAIMQDISQEITNQIVTELIDWNFGTGRYPVVSLQPNYSNRRQVVQQIFERISSAKQVNTTAEFWLRVERAVAEQLGFEGDIDYDAKEEEFKALFKKQQSDVRKPPAPAKPPTPTNPVKPTATTKPPTTTKPKVSAK